MAIPLTIFDPRVSPRLRCAVDKLSLVPGDYANIANLRSGSGMLMVRMPDATVTAIPPTGAKVTAGVYFPMGSSQVFGNGTAYFLSAWQMAVGGVGVFLQDPVTGGYTEITDPGAVNASTWGGSTTGNNRFATQSANVSYSVQTRSRRVSVGTVIPNIDVILIQNGEDPAIVYNPGSSLVAAAQVMWNPSVIVVPSLANSFHTLTSLSSFWQVRGNTKTYAASAGPPKVNQANFKCSDSALLYGVTDATLRVVLLTMGTGVGSGDIATVQFPLSGVTNQESFRGQWLYTFWEATQTGLTSILKDTKLEIGKENVGYASVTTWTTIYDPTSTDPSFSQLPDFLPLDPGGTHFCLAFTLQNISTLANRTGYHLRFTRVNANVPSATTTAYLLAAGSTGSGGGFPFGTEWTAVYKDIYTDAESGPYVQFKTDVDLLYNVGGPRGPDANSTTAMTLPRLTQVWYDYRMKVKMPDSNTAINGGLNGQPSHVDFYFRNPGQNPDGSDIETTAFYWSSWEIWNPNISVSHRWSSNAQAGAGGTETLKTEQLQSAGVTPDGFGYAVFGQVDYLERDTGIPVPSDENQSVPRAAVLASALGRCFVGNTKYSGVYSRQEIRFSDYGFWARFPSIQDIANPNSGGRLTFDGETIKAFRATAAGAQGASTFNVWTDQSWSTLGAGPGYTFTGSGFNSFNLGQRFRNSADGTNEPGSIIDRNGTLVWLNNDGHWVITNGGLPVNISMGHVTNPQGVTNSQVTDIVADIPASRRGHVRGIYARHRYYWFLTPASGTTNSRCVIFDEARGLWESLDTLVSGEQATSIYDSAQNGAGRRILLHGSDGKTYGYEEATSGTITVRLTTRAFTASEIGIGSDGYGYTTDDIEYKGDADPGNNLTVDCYTSEGAVSYQFSFDLGKQTTLVWITQHNLVSGASIPSWVAYYDVNAVMTGGKALRGILAYAEVSGSNLRAQG